MKFKKVYIMSNVRILSNNFKHCLHEKYFYTQYVYVHKQENMNVQRKIIYDYIKDIILFKI